MYSNNKASMNASDITLVIKGVLFSDKVKKMKWSAAQDGSARQKVLVPFALGYIFVSDKAVVVQQCDLNESSYKEGMRKVVRKQVLPNQPFTLAPIELSALMKNKKVRAVTETGEEICVAQKKGKSLDYVYPPVFVSDKCLEQGVAPVLIETCSGLEYARFHALVEKIKGKTF